MKTVRRPPYPKWNPGYFPCSSLTPLPLSSRRPSVSFGGFGLRDRDLATRQATTRSVRTADNIEEQRRAIQRHDWPTLQELQARMIEDGSLGEILSGFHGLPYADIQDIIPDLPNRPMRFQFQRDAQRVQQLDRRLRQAQAALGQQLTAWVMLQTGVPNNAPQMALQQAQRRLASL